MEINLCLLNKNIGLHYEILAHMKSIFYFSEDLEINYTVKVNLGGFFVAVHSLKRLDRRISEHEKCNVSHRWKKMISVQSFLLILDRFCTWRKTVHF